MHYACTVHDYSITDHTCRVSRFHKVTESHLGGSEVQNFSDVGRRCITVITMGYDSHTYTRYFLLQTLDGGRNTTSNLHTVCMLTTCNLVRSQIHTTGCLILGTYNVRTLIYMTRRQRQRYTARTTFSLIFQRKNCPGWDSNPRHSLHSR